EILSAAEPFVVCDTGHNAEAIAVTLNQLRGQAPFEDCHFVWGAVGDKDLKGVLSLLPESASYYWCKPSIPRGLDAGLLSQAAAELNLRGQAFSSVAEAYRAALSKAEPHQAIYVGGSTFVVADLLAHLNGSA
ncbi:MAG: glutamate ligase domain-containing protein, partial [Bacteroidia bacterium]